MFGAKNVEVSMKNVVFEEVLQFHSFSPFKILLQFLNIGIFFTVVKLILLVVVVVCISLGKAIHVVINDCPQLNCRSCCHPNSNQYLLFSFNA